MNSIIFVLVFVVLIPASWFFWYQCGKVVGRTEGLEESRDAIRDLNKTLRRELGR